MNFKVRWSKGQIHHASVSKLTCITGRSLLTDGEWTYIHWLHWNWKRTHPTHLHRHTFGFLSNQAIFPQSQQGHKSKLQGIPEKIAQSLCTTVTVHHKSHVVLSKMFRKKLFTWQRHCVQQTWTLHLALPTHPLIRLWHIALYKFDLTD